jgi:hypothetical protein
LEFEKGRNRMEIEEAKKLIFESTTFDEGSRCPCCAQFVKLYRRKITSSMAFALLLMYKELYCKCESASAFERWFHAEDFLRSRSEYRNIRGNNHSLLVYFGLLIKEEQKEREDGSNRVGLYKLTQAGKGFARGFTRVPEAVYLYNDRLYKYDQNTVTIHQALKEKFNYNELMDGIVIPKDNAPEVSVPIQTTLF